MQETLENQHTVFARMKNQTRTSQSFSYLSAAFLIVFLFAPSAWAKDSDNAARQARALLQQMTLEEKIGQMTQVDADALKGRAGDVQKYFIGSVLSGGSSDPADNNPRTWLKSVREFQGWSSRAGRCERV
jgi:hypothetical protein